MSKLTMNRKILGLVGWLAASFTTAAVGAIASVQAGQFYQQLARPDWAPPSSVFGPVWTVLYALMALAAWLVWREGGFKRNRTMLTIFLIQLGFNALWSWLFFAWHRGAWALADILLLWVLILVATIGFWRVRAVAGIFFIPYLLWVSFAAVLNYYVWQLNPGLLG